MMIDRIIHSDPEDVDSSSPRYGLQRPKELTAKAFSFPSLSTIVAYVVRRMIDAVGKYI